MEVFPTAVGRPVSARSSEASPIEMLILSALGSDGRYLTLQQLRARTGVPVSELQRVIARLCASRSVRRLNTIVESFCVSGLD